ncbi:hypothetical protein AcW1_008133 [Taiwanofungus camphoratus]|nr:hypothetical protein AcW1_008133 [Antrodia cinnamomea]
MTSVSQPGSTSPRWDSRNQGFISPAQLQQWRQQQRASHEIPSSPPQEQPSQQDMRLTTNRKNSAAPSGGSSNGGPSSGGHTRTISSFSLFKGWTSHQEDSSASSSTPQRQQQADNQHEGTNGSAKQSRIPVSRTNSERGPLSPATITSQQSRSNDSSTLNRASTAGSIPAGGLPPLHPEIRSIVQLTMAHAHKIYYSGPLVRHVERQPDGQKPTKDDGWRDVWAQLGGTTLSVWDMQAIDEASKQGRQVPPTYINVTDAFVNVLGSVTVPPSANAPQKRYSNVVTLNTAGSNLLLFCCSSPEALVAWTAALRLSAWEKSRLEEIYTAHLIRITLNDGRETPSPLASGRLEGWVRIRIAGQTDWKRMWMVVNAGSPNATRKKRMSHLFSRERSPQRSVAPSKPMIQLLASPKPKDKKKPLLTMKDVTQAFAVYPERPEFITRSTLIKLEGLLGDEDIAAGMKLRECWVLVMPEFEGSNARASEMLKWLIAIHDAFELYGRPHMYSWDPRDPRSMMFAYPIGPHRDLLFLDREFAETLDPRDDRTSFIRSRLQNILLERMRGPGAGQTSTPAPPDRPPVLPPLPDVDSEDEAENEAEQSKQLEQRERERQERPSMQLPPLNFESPLSEQSIPPAVPEKRALTPITERSVPRDTSRSLSTENHLVKPSAQYATLPTSIPESSRESASVLGQPVVSSPVAASPPLEADFRNRRSEDAHRMNIISRPESRLSRMSDLNRPPSRSSLAQQSNVSPQTIVKVPTSPEPDMRSFASVPRTTSPRTTSSPTSSSHQPASISMSPSRPASPYIPSSSPLSRIPNAPKSPRLPAPSRAATSSPIASPQAQQAETEDILQEAGALYYMQHLQQESGLQVPVHRGPPPTSKSDDDETQSDDTDSYTPPPRTTTSPVGPLRIKHTSPPPPVSRVPAPIRRDTDTPISQSNLTESPSAVPATASRSGMVRKPSGARAAPSSKLPAFPRNSFAPNRSPKEVDEVDDMESAGEHDTPPPDKVARAMETLEDPDADALAALTFLEQEESTTTTASQHKPSPPSSAPSSAPPIPEVIEPSSSPSRAPVDRREYRSSFAPSRQAAERKAKTQAQQAAHQAAVSRPGKANGKGKPRNQSRGAWAESSDEEEEEEEEEDDEDADSDAEPPPRMASRTSQQPVAPSMTPSSSVGQTYPQGRVMSPAGSGTDFNTNAYPQHRRPPRELPQLPGQRTLGDQDEYLGPQPRRLVSDQFSEAGRRSLYPDGPRQPSPSPNFRPQSEFPHHPGAARQTIWSQVLEPGRGHSVSPPPANSGNRDTFVQIEPPSQAMTKAFTPHGLLSAGLQDRQDRSAKRQEELARESGASLINVPSKPPPPQTGLLGAVTAHERERKREGGFGATLTEREREKRLAEERQRKLDEFQRQQLDHMQQGGSMYGGMGMPPFNPMMSSPMMMGMNPMMTGNWGFPGMMPGFANPQHMFAAQQAAMQAYQQAMVALSAAGSHVGGEGGGPAPLNPMMTGGSMGMGGLDPRMSMMGMPMMSPSMGMNPGMGISPNMTGGMGMGMNSAMSPGMSPGMGMSPMGMGMQMAGGGFDGRSPPSAFDSGLQHPSDVGGSGQRPYSSQNSSAGGHDSPAGPRPPEAVEEPTRGRPGATSNVQ